MASVNETYECCEGVTLVKRFLAAVLILLVAISAGCAKSQTPPGEKKSGEVTAEPKAHELVLSLLQKGDAEALSRLSGAQGLRVAAYATDGGSQVTGQQLTDLWKALLKDSKPELVATNGSGQVMHLAVKGLNQVDLPGQQRRSTELVQLSIEFEDVSKYRLVTLTVDNQGLLAQAVAGGDRWVPSKK